MVDHNGYAHYSPDTEARNAAMELKHQAGLEVDHTQDGLQTVPNIAGLENVPAEYQKGAILQTNYGGPEKETWTDNDKEIISPEESNEPQRRSVLKKGWKLWVLLGVLLVIVVVVAVAVPLSVRHKSG